jgi:uncharacterized protein (TIGR03083 family)
MAVNPMEASGKATVLDVVRTEREKFNRIVGVPENWLVQTRCEEWQIRDMVGHMIDVTEGYLSRWEIARAGGSAGALGLGVMAEKLNERAQALRSLSRDEAIDRLKRASDRMLATFDQLTPEQWTGFLVPHPYMGPAPAGFYPAFQIMDYGVHTWDMQWGLGQRDVVLDERTAGVLVPYMFILMQYTVDQQSAAGVDIVVGLKIDGEWGGQWRVTVKDGQFAAYPATTLDDVGAVIHFHHPSDFVLTAFQRFPGGEAVGDRRTIEQFRNLFFRI